MTFSNKTFCTLPWTSIQINPSGNFKICCFSGSRDGAVNNHGIGKDEDGEVMNVLTHSIEDALNSDLHKQLRLAQSRDERHPVCRVCWDKELAHERQLQEGHVYDLNKSGISHRVLRTFRQLNSLDGAITAKNAHEYMGEDGAINNTPLMLDIRFSNLCNSKCIQCEPQYSTLWYKDHIALTGRNTFNVGPKTYEIREENNKLVTDMVRWHDSPLWWEQFERIKDRLQFVYITGGEPFVQPAHDEFLDRLIAADLAQNITLEYDTNLTVINSKILNRLSKFKSLRFAVSLDDIEDKYELIRFPCKWDKLSANLKQIHSLIDVAETRITSCVGIMNVYSPMRLVPHFLELGYKRFPQRLLRSPMVYDLAFLTKDMKEEVLQKYARSNLHPQHKAVVMGYLKNNMGRHTDEACEQQLKGYVTRMDALDKLRGTDWKAVFPDAAEMLKKFI